MTPRTLIRLGIVLIVAGALLLQFPAGLIDSIFPASYALLAGIGRAALSVSNACLAFGAAFLGAGLVLRSLGRSAAQPGDDAEDLLERDGTNQV